MCGIAGSVNYPALQNSHRLMEHRGPDSFGVWQQGDVTLLHRRLAILDLSPAGHQPMEFEDLVITYNGEVYNFQEIREELTAKGYTFHSSSDTEVILKAFHCWGKECVKKLNGMFAFCICNKTDGSLFIARDHVGIKPLYYGLRDGIFIFASELKMFPELMRAEKNETALIKFLVLSYIPAPDTAFAAIQKLEPGSWLHYSSGQIQIEKFWSYDDSKTHIDQYEISSFEQAVAITEKKLTESVERQMVADVPVGSFLSGGVDSSLVTALAQKISNKPVQTFGMGFPVRELDESPHAAAVAAHLKTDHTTLMFTPDELLELLPDYDFYFDEPFGDTASLPLSILCKKAREAGIAVALSGDGGDEFFLGYDRYEFAPKYSALFSKNPRFLRGIAAGVLKTSGKDKAVKMAPAVQDPRVISFYQLLYTCIKPWDLHKALDAEFLRENMGTGSPGIFDLLNLPEGSPSSARDLAEIDIRRNLPDDMLVKADRASMRFSLEMRVPIIDREIMELSAAIPQEFHLKNGKKSILKEILYRYVPREIIDRPKRGFEVPVAHWLRNELRPELDGLKENMPTFVRQSYVDKLITEHLAGYNHSYTLWNLMRLKKFCTP